MNKNVQVYWMMLLLGLPFAAVGLGTLFMSILPELFEWQQMKSWPQVSAELQHAELVINHSSRGSSTYSVSARYSYQYQGKHYMGERVSISTGSDNIGDFHQNLAYRLKDAWHKQLPVPAWVNPAKPADAVLSRDMHWDMLGFQMVFVLMFGSIGIVISCSALGGLLRRTPLAGQIRKFKFEQQSASPEIPCNSKNGLWLKWGFTLIWNLLALLAIPTIPRELAAGNYFFLFTLAFPLIGIYFFYETIKATLNWRRFGPLTLRLNAYPCVIGGQLGGILDLPLVYNKQQRFEVRLLCVHSYETGLSGKRHLTEAVLWKVQGLAQSQASPMGGTRLSLGFDIPDNLPASEPESTDYRFWRLELAARLPGVDLWREFIVPVFAATAPTHSPLPSIRQ